MQSLVENFGIDWRLLLSQFFNFLVILAIFTFLIYKPLSKNIAERRKKIKEGLDKEEEASERLSEIAVLEKETLKKAEGEAVGIISGAEARAKERESEILQEAEEKNKEMQRKALEEINEEKQESLRKAEKEIASLAKEVLVKAVKVNPSAVDEALLKRVTEETVKEK